MVGTDVVFTAPVINTSAWLCILFRSNLLSQYEHCSSWLLTCILQVVLYVHVVINISFLITIWTPNYTDIFKGRGMFYSDVVKNYVSSNCFWHKAKKGMESSLAYSHCVKVFSVRFVIRVCHVDTIAVFVLALSFGAAVNKIKFSGPRIILINRRLFKLQTTLLISLLLGYQL